MDTEILIDHDLPAEAVQRVIEHELGHAKGLRHTHDPTCVMISPPLLAEAFCEEEVRLARTYGKVSTVRVLDSALRPFTAKAIDRWNAAAGEVLFVLE